MSFVLHNRLNESSKKFTGHSSAVPYQTEPAERRNKNIILKSQKKINILGSGKGGKKEKYKQHVFK